VHVLGVRDQRGAALRLQRSPPVDRGRADADGRAEPVPCDLDRPVEHLLDRASGVLDPRLRGAAPEELGRLDNRDFRVVQVGKRLGEEVAPRREVGVQDDQVFAIRAGEGVPQVAALLADAQIRSADVAEAEGLGHRTSLVRGAVVEYEGLS